MRSSLALLAVLTAATARAESPFPARLGETGYLDVPSGEVVGAHKGLLGIELGASQASGQPLDSGPLPVYAVAGLHDRLDLGLAMRQWGQPGDPLPGRVQYTATTKLQLMRPEDGRPALALGLVGDRFGSEPVLGARLAASMAANPWLDVAAFVGGEVDTTRSNAGVTWGGAAELRLRSGWRILGEALGGPRGPNFGGAVRWIVKPTLAVQLGANYLPDDQGWTVALGFVLRPSSAARQPSREAEPQPEPEPAPAAPVGPRFASDRPQFKLRMPIDGPDRIGEPRRLQYGEGAPALANGSTRPGVPGLRAPVPSLDDLAEAQMREQEALAEARERRIGAAADQLTGRERAVVEATKNLDARERELAARETQLDARERRIGFRGAPSPEQRELEALEAQEATRERNLAAQERAFVPAVEAARGRQQDAAARADAERQETNRLAASVSGAAARAQQVEVRKQALAARARQQAALELSLVAKGEELDGLERQAGARGEQLDAWTRRLDVRFRRLDLLEQRAAPPGASPAQAGVPGGLAAAAPKGNGVFVVVVKSPTAIVREGGPAVPAPAAAAAPGAALEKAVTAATVIAFPTPTSTLGELDRESVESIARLAAHEGCEVLVWARAKDPALMAEAQRRAAEIKARVVEGGPVPERQVVTRITTRPGAQGIDVVVSALRSAPRTEPAAPAAAGPGRPALEPGEGGKRQIRDAVQGVQRSIEACVSEVLEAKHLARAEGVLRITVARGRATQVSLTGDLAGPGAEKCLEGAASAWTFPSSEADYVVDVPLTVVHGGAW